MISKEENIPKTQLDDLYNHSNCLNRESITMDCHPGHIGVVSDLFRAIDTYCFYDDDFEKTWSLNQVLIVIKPITRRYHGSIDVCSIDGKVIRFAGEKNKHINKIEKTVNDFMLIARKTCPSCGEIINSISSNRMDVSPNHQWFLPKLLSHKPRFQYFCSYHYPLREQEVGGEIADTDDGIEPMDFSGNVASLTFKPSRTHQHIEEMIQLKEEMTQLKTEVNILMIEYKLKKEDDAKIIQSLKEFEDKKKTQENKNDAPAIINEPIDPDGIYIDFHADNDDHIDKLHQGLSKQEKQEYVKGIAEKMKRSGLRGKRKLIKIQHNYLSMLNEFEQRFPNFIELSNFLKSSLALADIGDGVIYFKPILLLGPPGVGKTSAARWIAKKIGLPFEFFDASTFQTASMLSGSESYWSNTDTGIIFKALVYKTVANPILMIDEIDKASSGHGSRQGHVLSPLLGLLEEETSRSFQDLSIRDIPVNASFINWIFTANNEKEIDPVIKSRLEIIRIAEPDKEQSLMIAQNIYREFVGSKKSWGDFFDPELSIDSLDAFGNLPPRAMRKIMFSAAAMAAQDHCQTISMEYIKKAESMIAQKDRRIGFSVD